MNISSLVLRDNLRLRLRPRFFDDFTRLRRLLSLYANISNPDLKTGSFLHSDLIVCEAKQPLTRWNQIDRQLMLLWDNREIKLGEFDPTKNTLRSIFRFNLK